jgi:hypothetical protein
LNIDLYHDDMFIGGAGTDGVDEMDPLFLLLGRNPGKVQV